MSTLLTNWKTTLTGVIALLLNVPVFVSAIYAWGKHQPVDWRSVLVTTTLTVVGAGLVAAKDSTTHSTIPQIEASTEKADEKQVVQAALNSSMPSPLNPSIPVKPPAKPLGKGIL